jgi:hypothetical protein
VFGDSAGFGVQFPVFDLIGLGNNATSPAVAPLSNFQVSTPASSSDWQMLDGELLPGRFTTYDGRDPTERNLALQRPWNEAFY